MKEFLAIVLYRKVTLLAIAFIALIVFFGLFAPILSPYDPFEMRSSDRLQSISAKHVFGTDNFGRDIFSRIVFGARTSLVSSVGVVLFSLSIGVLVGVFSGYYKKIETFLMRVIDVMMAFPPLLVALVLMSIFGRSLINVILAVGISYLTRTTRIVYGLTLRIKEETFIEAFRSCGVGDLRLIFVHILPNIISPIIVQGTFTFAFSLLDMAALDFLGVGLPPEIPSWGNMLSEGSIYLVRAPWLLMFPGLFIVLTVLSFNLMGDTLRDQMDPRFRHDIQGV